MIAPINQDKKRHDAKDKRGKWEREPQEESNRQPDHLQARDHEEYEHAGDDRDKLRKPEEQCFTVSKIFVREF
jgi:hypothetical protein